MAANEDNLASHSHLPEDGRYHSPWDPEQKGLPKEKGQTDYRVLDGEGDTRLLLTC